MLRSFSDPRAASSLIFARIVYALNWVNFGAIFYLMGPDLGSGVSGLGTVTSTFYLGLGIMQIPGGLLAAKLGPKRVVVAGIFLSSFSVLGTAVATTVTEAAVLRFLVGWGMAFVFAPAVIIISRLLRGGKSGMGVGLLNSAFDIGGIFGLFGWVLVAILVGWRQSLALAGVLGLITGVLVAAFLPSDSTGGGFRIDGGSLRKVLLDRQLILLGLGTMGFGFAYTDVSGFMNLYGVNELNVSPVVAGLVTSFITIVPIFTALWGGRAFDVIAAHRNIMVASIAGSGLALAIASVPTLYAAAACSVLGGVVTGIGYTFAFAGARELNRAGKEYESLAVGWVNSISLTGTSAPSFIFSQVAGKYGYGDAWLSGGLLTLAFVLPILLMVRIWRG